MADKMTGLCGRCNCKTEWSIGHAFEKDLYGDIHISHTFVCNECGITVQETTWPTYQRIMKERLVGKKGE